MTARSRCSVATSVTLMLVLAGALDSSRPGAQTFRTATRRLVFEVLSLGISPPGTRGGFGWRGDEVFFDDASVLSLIRHGYGVAPWEVVGAPDWVSRERYHIAAKLVDSPEFPSSPELRDTVRALLDQLFDMKAHNELREQLTYSLTVGGATPGLGPQLRRSAVDCAAFVAARRGSADPAGLPRAFNGTRPCETVRTRGQIASGGMSMPILASALGNLAGRVVIDETGLAGYYELTLRYPASQSPGGPENTSALATSSEAVAAAVQEQLGLTLESRRRRVEVLVVDRIKRPMLR